MRIERYPNGPLNVNTYLVYSQNSNKAMVIDPSYDVRLVIDRIDELELNVEYTINTHAHIDHIAGNKAMKDKTGGKLVSHSIAKKSIENPAPSMVIVLPPMEDSPPVEVVVEDGDSIQVDDLSLNVVFTPGHCPGHICLIADRSVFVGDLIFAGSIGRTDFPNCNPHHMSDSLEKIWTTVPNDFDLLPGHGPISRHSIEKESNYLYRRMTGNA